MILLLVVALLSTATPEAAAQSPRRGCLERCADLVDGCVALAGDQPSRRRHRIERFCRRRIVRTCLRDGDAACPSAPPACPDVAPLGLVGAWEGAPSACTVHDGTAASACEGGAVAALRLVVLRESCGALVALDPFLATGEVAADGAFALTSTFADAGLRSVVSGRLEDGVLRDVVFVRVRTKPGSTTPEGWVRYTFDDLRPFQR